MKHFRQLAYVTVVIFLSGCAAMNEQECQTASWYDIGLEDGSAGRPMTNLSAYRQACAKHGVTADAGQYNQGYNEGVINFCTPQKGYNLGRNGQQYYGVCPAPLERPFVSAYQEGNKIFQQEQVVQRLARQISNNEQRISDLTVAISEAEVALLSEGLTTEERKAQLELMLDLQDQKSQAKAALQQAVSQKAVAEQELAQLQAGAPY